MGLQLSLWQQFSSNHSGGFDLVGQFKTAEEAQKAYDVVWDFISKIAAYYHKNPEWLEKVYEYYFAWLTPVEEELAKEYDLKNWENSIDWADATTYDEMGNLQQVKLNRGLRIYENLVFLHEFTETWLYVEPFDELLEKLGATIKFRNNGISEDSPVVNLSCTATNAESVGLIVQSLSSNEISGENVLPLINLPDGSSYWASISCIDSMVMCSDLPTSWYPSHITEFLPKLVEYLKENGCTNFKFSIASKVHE